MTIKQYKLVNPIVDGMIPTMIHRIDAENSCWIPMDPANTDYQEYLAWLAEGNTPDPAPDHSDSVADHPE